MRKRKHCLMSISVRQTSSNLRERDRVKNGHTVPVIEGVLAAMTEEDKALKAGRSVYRHVPAGSLAEDHPSAAGHSRFFVLIVSQ